MTSADARRRALLLATAAAAVTAAVPRFARADTYPGQPIKIIVPYTPAGGTDIVTRMTATHVGQATGWTFVIDNRPGGSGNLGMEIAAKAKPDGYTLAMGQTANLAINPTLLAAKSFDPLKDFVPIAMVASVPTVVVVRGDGPFKTLADVVKAAQASPGKLTQALAGIGTVGHLSGELFARRAGVRFTNVPYKGAAPALTDLIGGQTDLMFSTPEAVVSLIRSGKLRALAVTSARRLTVLPDAPTIAESGYAGFEAVDWKALVAPAGTPVAIVKTLNAAVNQALGQPGMLGDLLAAGSGPMGGTPEQAAQRIKTENARWGALIREAGIKPE